MLVLEDGLALHMTSDSAFTFDSAMELFRTHASLMLGGKGISRPVARRIELRRSKSKAGGCASGGAFTLLETLTDWVRGEYQLCHGSPRTETNGWTEIPSTLDAPAIGY